MTFLRWGDTLELMTRLDLALSGQTLEWHGALPALAAGAATAAAILLGLRATLWRRRAAPPRRRPPGVDALPPGVAETLERRTIRRGRAAFEEADPDPAIADRIAESD